MPTFNKTIEMKKGGVTYLTLGISSSDEVVIKTGNGDNFTFPNEGGVIAVNNQSTIYVTESGNNTFTGENVFEQPVKIESPIDSSDAANKEYVDSMFVGGPYNDLIAGKALVSEQLENVSEESGSLQDKPFLFQATGTDSNTTETSTAPIAKHLELQGNTIVWNQKAQYVARSDQEITWSIVGNNVVRFNGTNTTQWKITNYRSPLSMVNSPIPEGHKIYIGGFDGKGKITLQFVGVNMLGSYQTVGETPRVYTPPKGVQYFGMAIEADTSFDNEDFVFPNVFDLTQMFGAGNEPTDIINGPTAAQQFDRLFPLPYYEYNLGELISCKSSSLATVGYNQFFGLNEFMRVIPNQTYRLAYWNGTNLAPLSSGSIEEYDYNKTLLKTTSYDTLSTLHNIDSGYPNNSDKGLVVETNTYYVKIVGSSNLNILFNLAWDGSKNNYEPYTKHAYSLPEVELRSAGTAKDVYTADGIKTINVVEYTFSADSGTFQVSSYRPNNMYLYYAFGVYPGIATPKSYRPGISDRYPVATSTSDVADKCFVIGVNNGQIYFASATELTNTEIHALVDGVTIYYQQDVPTITTNNPTFTETIEVDDFGTMEFIKSSDTTESASRPIAPQGNEFFYPADYVLLIDDLNEYVNGDVGALARKDDLLPLLPSNDSDGTYVLKAVKSGNTITYTWVLEQ